MSYNFTQDYKYIDVYIQQTEDLVTFVLNDTGRVKLDVSLGLQSFFGRENFKDTKLLSFEQIGSEYVDSLNMKMLVLADLTVPQDIIDKEYYAIREIRNLYTNKNLYVSFITPHGITNSLPADDYLMGYSFTRKELGDKYLYRSISHLLDEFTDTINVFSSSKFGALLIMSDANVYNADTPIDPENYEIQEELIEQVNNLSKNKNISIFYANYAHSEAVSDPAAINLMKLICKKTNGVYSDGFDWPTMKRQILSRFNLNIPDYKIRLVNADGTVFKGTDNLLELKFLNAKNDTLLVEAKKNIRAGSVFNPIIVNGRNPHVIILQGIVVVLLLIMIIYVIFQYIIPYIKYRLFMKKYITQYTGNQMIFNEHPVEETCYYCKAPFEKGDEIVVKCQHVMHKECWEENGQHCPEYGRHCKDGSHYYNKEFLADPRNASFYLKWIVLSLIAGLVAWIIFTLHVRSFAASILEEFFQYMYNIEPTDDGYQQKLTDFSSNFRQLPSFGLCISFATTFLFSLLSVFRRKRAYFYTECFIRALVAGIGGWLAFIFVAMLYISLDINEQSFLLSWLPWPMMGCIIAVCVTWHTRIKFRRYWIWVS
ncbi:MAG: E3 ubiquitin protein ligase, partial [Lachnospiraceae bacterium]|nr:E3 ubiquitin protein ligase [Lachnospiraceae bacterium]